MKLLFCIATGVTLFVACGDLEEKEIAGYDMKNEFLKTHADTFENPNKQRLTFDKSGAITQKQVKEIEVSIQHLSGDSFYLSDKYSNNVELIKENAALLAASTGVGDNQTTTLQCHFTQNGQLISLVKLPKEYPLDKIAWNLRNTISNIPDANYLMQLNLEKASVTHTQVLDRTGAFFSSQLDKILMPYYKAMCDKKFDSSLSYLSGYNGSFDFALPDIDKDQLDFLVESKFTWGETSNKTKKYNSLYRLGDRIFVRKGKNFELDHYLEQFLSKQHYRAHSETNEYIPSSSTRKLIPTVNIEKLKISPTKNGDYLVRWQRTGCELDVSFKILGIDIAHFNHQHTDEVPLLISDITVNKADVDYNKCSEYTDKDINRFFANFKQRTTSPFQLYLKPNSDYYMDSFTLYIRLDESSYSNSNRFLPQ
ncbi:MAG: hypothetical protein KDD40_03230 [Bdellovibrionales bacterium]|nr:hypothetical protein [Bdellovibrionales bacterium]